MVHFDGLPEKEATMSSRKVRTKKDPKNKSATPLPQARRAAKIAKRITHEVKPYGSVRELLVLGGAVAALGAAAGAGIFGRRSIARRLRNSLEDVSSAGRSVGHSARHAGAAIGSELDVARLLSHLGIPRRRSLLRRMTPGLAWLGGIAAAAATTIFLLRSRKLAEVIPGGNEATPKSDGDTRAAYPSSDNHNSVSTGSQVHAHQ
jgi:hypothetical protein